MKTYLTISSTIFLLVAIIHLLRFLLDWNFEFGPLIFPHWISAVVGVLGIVLFIWAWRLKGKR